MSGGHFNYDDRRISDIIEEMDRLIASNNDQTLDRWNEPVGRFYSDDIIEKFKITRDVLDKAMKMTHCVDYLLCGDYGEDSFNEAWNSDFPK